MDRKKYYFRERSPFFWLLHPTKQKFTRKIFYSEKWFSNAEYHISSETLESKIKESKNKLLNVRAKRVKPRLDDKIWQHGMA
jgi:uncharacterized protein YyaL (SSP411 family)